MVTAPQGDGRKEFARAFAEAVASFIPGSAAAIRMYQYFRPPDSHQDRKEWEAIISNTVNSHTARIGAIESFLQQEITLSNEALAIVKCLIEGSKDGLETIVEMEEIHNHLQFLSEPQTIEAICELQEYGFVEYDDFYNLIFPQDALYFAFDIIYKRYNTVDDALVLAKYITSDDEMRHIEKLYTHTGWDKRRFNIALCYVLMKTSLPKDKKYYDFPIEKISPAPKVTQLLKKFISENDNKP